ATKNRSWWSATEPASPSSKPFSTRPSSVAGPVSPKSKPTSKPTQSPSFSTTSAAVSPCSTKTSFPPKPAKKYEHSSGASTPPCPNFNHLAPQRSHASNATQNIGNESREGIALTF